MYLASDKELLQKVIGQSLYDVKNFYDCTGCEFLVNPFQRIEKVFVGEEGIAWAEKHYRYDPGLKAYVIKEVSLEELGGHIKILISQSGYDNIDEFAEIMFEKTNETIQNIKNVFVNPDFEMFSKIADFLDMKLTEKREIMYFLTEKH